MKVDASTNINMNVIWILIQVNAVLAFLSFGSNGIAGAGEKQLFMSGISLLLAALLEYFGYKYMYKISEV